MKKKVMTQRLQSFQIRAVTVIITIMTIIMFMGANPLLAAKSKGNSIKLFMKDGAILKGELLAVSGRTLVLFDRAAEKKLEASIDEVKELILIKDRKLRKGLIGGALFGAAAGKIAGLNLEGDNQALTQVGGIGLGAGLGALSSFVLGPKPRHYPIHKMTGAEIEALLSSLDISARSNVELESKTAYKDGLLGRFRILWRPYYYPELGMYWGGNIEMPGSDPLTEQVSTMVELAGYSEEDEGHLGRVRIDYALRDWISLGVEFFAMGEINLWGWGGIDITQGGKGYYAGTILRGHHSAKFLLAGATIGFREDQGILRALQFETSVGLSFTGIQFDNAGDEADWTPTIKQSFHAVNPAFQVGLSVELYPGETFTSGIYATYLVAPSTFPEFHARGSASFYEANQYTNPGVVFKRDAELIFPKTTFDVSGFSLGFFVRFR